MNIKKNSDFEFILYVSAKELYFLQIALTRNIEYWGGSHMMVRFTVRQSDAESLIKSIKPFIAIKKNKRYTVNMNLSALRILRASCFDFHEQYANAADLRHNRKISWLFKTLNRPYWTVDNGYKDTNPPFFEVVG